MKELLERINKLETLITIYSATDRQRMEALELELYDLNMQLLNDMVA